MSPKLGAVLFGDYDSPLRSQLFGNTFGSLTWFCLKKPNNINP